MTLRLENRINDDAPCGIALRVNNSTSVGLVFHGAKEAKGNALSAERKASKAINHRFRQMDTEKKPFRNITAEAQRAQNKLCDPCVLGTNSDPNFVTFVLFVVTNCFTTKDAKYTKEEIQKRPQIIKFLFVGRRRQTKTLLELEL